ncbi:bifunctional adenosylcobinamide kinase/adenosylcobinamide-phosphate guanylyltransferase [Halomonas sp. NO4]|uniref:bifunctional adenosylcobinamide kinase/adenosylcobinamide-phosphate guanylyltransferase n=1 Tax=Halomonas sp. NO4 TaxID=2484813 RepID=UPI0013D5169A|nr:bifunctional adenosylcobinamide kinase/adenosylcobinamide-phosphate guanylyltransferase [Halomonas sp. NO4]
MIAFVSGGARSGKSEVAERLARECRQAGGGTLYYLATATASDAEMAARIARHRRDRGAEWHTREAPLALGSALDGIDPGSSVLLDCLTLWASRARFEAGFDSATGTAQFEALLVATRARSLDLVVVSNDLNEAVLPGDLATRGYVAFLQCLHRQLAREADRVVEVVAGIAIDWKSPSA